MDGMKLPLSLEDAKELANIFQFNLEKHYALLLIFEATGFYL
jgi:hypothetical protein